MSLRVWKYHGTGNDFVLLEDLAGERPLTAELAAALCDRRFGVGADGVIRVAPGRELGEDAFMDYRNADGSLAEMCGNGIRCLGRFLYDEGLASGTELAIGTRAGTKRLRLELSEGAVAAVTVGMGPARLRRGEIPMAGPADEPFLGQPFEVDGETFTAAAVSMGNPHLVLFLDQVPSVERVRSLGPRIEGDERFPQRTNVELVHVQDEVLVARVWERGSGETMACGTGACAVLVAANEVGLAPRRAEVRFPGGTVVVERTEEEVLLTGPAERVFAGVLDEGWMRARGLG